MAQIAELFERINVLKRELDALRPLDREREDRVMQKFRLWWTYHSNAIEGNKLSQGETEMFLMEGLTAKGKPLKDHLDLRGHSNAVNFLLAFVREKEPLTEAVMRELHRVLLVEPYKVDALTPDGRPTSKTVAIGEYKSSPNHVRTPTGEIHYYATPEETAAKMHDLMTWYREETANGVTHPVEIAAVFHHRFTAVHPFDDGNGRMARLLTNLMFMQGGYPPVVIRLTERDVYLAALRRADRGEHNDLIALIGDHVANSLELFVRAAKGEEISEPTDLKKEIALEILRLKHVEEPVQKANENVLEVFRQSIQPLVQMTANLLAPFRELFSEMSVTIMTRFSGKHANRPITHQLDFIQPDLAAHLSACSAQGFPILDSRITFNFNAFRKARFDTFSLTPSIQIQYEQFKYRVSLHWNKQHRPVEHFYQEQITSDELTPLVEQMARYVLEEIHKRSQSSS